ncbi:MAG: thioredoxin [Bacteroidales bacterium]|nr:thioredoxin [Bacteroidales bacterium]
MSTILTPENAESMINQELPVVLDFGATWCGPCKKVSAIMDEIAAEYEGRVAVLKADVDECEDLAIDYKVRNVPTILFIKNGQVVDKQAGAAAKNVFVEKIEAML